MTQRITAWYVTTKTGIEFNHISDGWTEHPEPVAVSEVQKRAWKGHTWSYEHLTTKLEVVKILMPTLKGGTRSFSVTVPSVQRQSTPA